jgi:hypothetical protein
MNDIDAALHEAERAIEVLDMKSAKRYGVSSMAEIVAALIKPILGVASKCLISG